MSLLFDFSPPCVFIKCVLRLPAWDDAKLHWLHLFTFSPLCVLYMYVIVASWLLPQDTLKLFQLFGQNPDIAFLNWLLWNILQNTAGKSAAKTQTLHYFSEFVSDRGLFDQLVSGQAVNPLQSRKRQLVVPTALKAWRRITLLHYETVLV